ncbi:MAG: DUF1579 domain-containing protein [Phycisphaerales bacterium]|nr:DUF1579 domain-containing protein [Phycisphaerales bacterium]
MDIPAPESQHKWLSQWIGDWTYEHECSAGPGQPAMKLAGRETIRAVGDLWIVGESRGEMLSGAPAIMIITLGYNPAKKRFVGTWIGSMMTHLWIYDGSLDETGRILTLNSEGPSFSAENKLAQYKDVFEIKSPDHRILTSHSLGEDGKWTQFMTGHYRKAR